MLAVQRAPGEQNFASLQNREPWWPHLPGAHPWSRVAWRQVVSRGLLLQPPGHQTLHPWVLCVPHGRLSCVSWHQEASLPLALVRFSEWAHFMVACVFGFECL